MSEKGTRQGLQVAGWGWGTPAAELDLGRDRVGGRWSQGGSGGATERAGGTVKGAIAAPL